MRSSEVHYTIVVLYVTVIQLITYSGAIEDIKFIFAWIVYSVAFVFMTEGNELGARDPFMNPVSRKHVG